MRKRIWAIWLVALIGVFGETFARVAIFAYDAQIQTRIAYDYSGDCAVGYDAVSVLAKGETKNRTDGGGVLFGKFAGFLAAESAPSFFDGASYTDKVQIQMQGSPGEFHSFPELVKNYESSGTVTPITGGDGITRQMLEIPVTDFFGIVVFPDLAS